MYDGVSCRISQLHKRTMRSMVPVARANCCKCGRSILLTWHPRQQTMLEGNFSAEDASWSEVFNMIVPDMTKMVCAQCSAASC